MKEFTVGELQPVVDCRQNYRYGVKECSYFILTTFMKSAFKRTLCGSTLNRLKNISKLSFWLITSGF